MALDLTITRRIVADATGQPRPRVSVGLRAGPTLGRRGARS